MAKIIDVSFPRNWLPRRVREDGWWLETPPGPARPGTPAARPSRNEDPAPLPQQTPQADPEANPQGKPDHDDRD